MRNFTVIFAGASLAIAAASAHGNGPGAAPDPDRGQGWVHENGIGPDPDGDTNPATDTRIVPFVANLLRGADGSVFPAIHFEPPPGRHGEAIRRDYADKYGVTFGPGLTWQICDGQRHFQYNSMCTYEAPTSGKFAAGYLNYLNAPLTIEFDKPVCLVTMSIYPTGAEEYETFEFAIEGWDETGVFIERAREVFQWRSSTVRFRNIAGAYFNGLPAKRITVSMRSLDEERRRRESDDPTDDRVRDTLRYLIDDLVFVSEGCDAAVSEVEARTGMAFEKDGRHYRLNRDE